VSTPRQAVTVRSRRHRAAVSLIVLLAVTLGSAGNLMVQPAGALEPPPTAASPYGPFATAKELVNQTYKDVLMREPTTTESRVAVSKLEGGTEPAVFVAGLVNSTEANTNVHSVIRLYRTYFLRNPDLRGFQSWVTKRIEGMPLAHISNQFAVSKEFSVRYGVLNDEQFVDLVYEKVLKRPADPAGRAFWLDRLRNGHHRGYVMIMFSESPEYVRGTWGVVTAVHVYTSLLQASIKLGPADTYGASLQNGRKTTEDLIRELMNGQAYKARFKTAA